MKAKVWLSGHGWSASDGSSEQASAPRAHVPAAMGAAMDC